MLQVIAVASVAVAGGLFVAGTGAYLYMRFVTARRGPRRNDASRASAAAGSKAADRAAAERDGN